MTKNENDRMAEFNIRLGNVEKATEANTQAIKDILKNHLPHFNMKLNMTLGGLVFIGIMITILGIIIGVAVLG